MQVSGSLGPMRNWDYARNTGVNLSDESIGPYEQRVNARTFFTLHIATLSLHWQADTKVQWTLFHAAPHP